ncbi:glucose-dependent insulinotropic receptor-like [Anopheles maculipalpis]|uniref:glucose-dependent insulinotropic receptor-like n=1 Tax=Anopheles maculipalpis TaxID=1496333 RepID=UPI002159988D|nr:glucose-dependent insulinotropic receptor-like [Anopheles maculipalpis]
MGKVQAQNYDDYDRIRYFYYIRPPQTPIPKDWWIDPMATTTESVTTLSASEETTLLLYDIFIPLLGSLIIILNLIVVVSGVLLLRKGQQPYTTYMFLGNVAVSDLLTGFAVIFGQYAPRGYRAEENCTLMIGLIVSTSLVSVYSVGLIAIDRYLYIVYGLQYQRYLTRTRARILIAATWLLGATIGFLPALGWRGDTDGGRTCWFIRLAPPGLVILTAVVGILPVVLVIILYGIILQKALRRVNQLKKASRELRGVQTGNLRLFRGGAAAGSANGNTVGSTHPTPGESPAAGELNRSGANQSDTDHGLSEDELSKARPDRRCLCLRSRCCSSTAGRAQKALNGTDAPNISTTVSTTMTTAATTTTTTTSSSKSPTKWKAIKVVMFTTGSFVVTWVPYFIASLMYVGCDPVTNGELCRSLQFAIASPLAILGFANSLLNPIIYAWWHNGFRASMKRLGSKVRSRVCCCCCCYCVCCGRNQREEDETGPCVVRCCHKSSRTAPSTDASTNRISANGSSSDGAGPNRLSNRTVTTTVGRRSRPANQPSSDQEFSITDDTDVEQPSGMVIGTRL